MDRETRLGLASQNHELTQLLKNTPPAKGLDGESDIFALRAHLAALKRKLTQSSTPAHASYTEEDVKISMRDKVEITARIHRPKSAPTGGSPGLVFWHGGGFCLGDCDNEVALCRKWTELGGVAVNVDYRLAPENPFPKAVEDAFDSLLWTSSHLTELGINPEKGFIVGGVSAGANLAAVVTHLYLGEKLEPMISGQYLSIPSICEPGGLPEKYKDMYLSREQNKDGLVLNQKSIDMFEGYYKPDSTSPLRSPLIFPSHEGLPPAYFQVSGADPLRDEGLIYEQVLREDSGVKTRLDIFPGLPHGFWSWFPQAEFSKDFQLKTVDGLKWLLEQGPS
ncbi:AB hydrolase superfamily [Hyphodiscus hymeniophilus]|uniref:AB hydrolase superfamily n=1 Tax=Hyphodiscus hymeniophilus TaxID=353542 RepID=A0A9P6VKJ0_9HELO|nr:AB hydrolase superfamily [Hyphodiscus hymeniophilus]